MVEGKCRVSGLSGLEPEALHPRSGGAVKASKGFSCFRQRTRV